ncbi:MULTISPECIES: helix-turn-helix transcriptional regulator [Streptomyces]|uniref:Helix-turn-helix transcriptional regulator n=1 Tax=Streptomyces pacificus TaxID=2705029 RepID=A0A6A0ASM3_9ACTN|nr:helix-turn-helix transcriptional regulator [Streptomyces pacificus]GFH35455.1 helix-turn-helix transcriptional regulator [Streptomyces pacificus]
MDRATKSPVFSGQKLRQVRHSRGLSQAEVAARMGTISGLYISYWENDRHAPNGVNMVLLLRALGCELEEVTE